MEIYIYDKNLNFEGIIDKFKSLIWTRRFQASGSFTLQCSLNDKSLKLLKDGNIIYMDNDDEIECDKEAGYITARKLSTSEGGKEIITVTGYFLTEYLRQRINWGRINFTGKAEVLMRQLVSDSSITPTEVTRKIPNLILYDLNNFNDEIEYQNSFGNIMECIENISNTTNIGFKAILDIKTKKIKFKLYKGINRSIDNGVISPCNFSREFENIIEQSYIESFKDYKNTTLIAGAGEGSERRITYMENGIGLERHELFIDARDLQDKKESDVVMTDTEYFPLLIQRGKEKLEKYKVVKSFASEIEVNGNNKYRINFDLGDKITIQDESWGLQIDPIISEINEIYENSSCKISVVFGDSVLTLPKLVEIIRQEAK